MTTPLQVVDTFVALDVILAMRASLVTTCARFIFYGFKTWFWSHPANTTSYMALGALEERSIINIAETLKRETAWSDVPNGIRRKADLVCHRHYLSHPTKVEWTHESMKQFVAQDRHHKDNRAALIWDMQRSINEQLRAEGSPVKHDALIVTPEMTRILLTIYEFSMTKEAFAGLPALAELHDSLERFRDRYLDFLVTQPAGTEAG